MLDRAAASERPWRMTAAVYEAEVARAAADGVELPTGARPCGSTPWDPLLESAFMRHGLGVHQERLVDDLLDPAS